MNKLLVLLISLVVSNTYANEIGGIEQQQIEKENMVGVKNIDNNTPSTIIPYGIDSANIKTIKANSRTLIQNMQHQNFCNDLGGVDITDSSDIIVTNDTLDAIYCKIVDEKRFNEYLKSVNFKKQIPIDGRLSEINPNSYLPNGSWQAFASSGSVNSQYYATAVGVYNNVNGQTVLILSIPSDKCSTSRQDHINEFSKQSVTALCGYWSHGQQPSYANACLNGSCVQDRG